MGPPPDGWGLVHASVRPAVGTQSPKDDLRLIDQCTRHRGLETGKRIRLAGHIDHLSATAANEMVVPPARDLIKRPPGSGIGEHHEAGGGEVVQDLVDRGSRESDVARDSRPR